MEFNRSKDQFGQFVQLFSDVEIQDLKVSLRLKIITYIYIIYTLQNTKYIQPKKIQFKPQIIGILGEIDSFY